MADDFFRWLNMVRPSTDADDHWSDSVEADAVLAAVYRRIRPRRRLVRSRTAIPVTISVLAAAVVVLVTTFSATPPPARHDSVPHIATPALRPAAQILTPFRSCADLLEGLRAHTAAHVSAYGLPGVGYGFPSHAYDEVRQGYSTNAGLNSAAGAPVDAAKAAEAQTSTTNVQEAGVDEPDIVKTQDNRVVTVTDGMLRVTRYRHPGRHGLARPHHLQRMAERPTTCFRRPCRGRPEPHRHRAVCDRCDLGAVRSVAAHRKSDSALRRPRGSPVRDRITAPRRPLPRRANGRVDGAPGRIERTFDRAARKPVRHGRSADRRLSKGGRGCAARRLAADVHRSRPARRRRPGPCPATRSAIRSTTPEPR